MKRAIIICLISLALYAPYYTYTAGRVSMYQDMLEAVGEHRKDAQIAVMIPNEPDRYTPAGICIECHKEAF